MDIGKYSDSDRKIVLSLWKECGLLAPSTDYSRDIDNKMRYQPELFFVGIIQGRIIGSIMVGYDGRRGWLNCLAIHPEYQKKGYGKTLVTFGIERLKELGCAKVNLQVRKTNNGVIAFYEKLGFKEDHVISLGKRLV